MATDFKAESITAGVVPKVCPRETHSSSLQLTPAKIARQAPQNFCLFHRYLQNRLPGLKILCVAGWVGD